MTISASGSPGLHAATSWGVSGTTLVPQASHPATSLQSCVKPIFGRRAGKSELGVVKRAEVSEDLVHP